MSFRIPRCYDSHLHLLATGRMQESLSLASLKDPMEIASLSLLPSYFYGDWLLGFGWDQHRWEGQRFPTREILDEVFPNRPVAFRRADGHALWVNSVALERAGLTAVDQEISESVAEQIQRHKDGSPTGILWDAAMSLVENLIPAASKEKKREFLCAAQKKMNEAGFTHIRDMSGSEDQWNLLCQLDDRKELTLYIEQNFEFEKREELEATIQMALKARAHQTPHLRSAGIKFYFDGALGSEGALLSQPYAHTGGQGFALWSLEVVKEIILRGWKENLEVSIHTIGDEAADLIARAAWEVWDSGVRGLLNIEHGEVIRPETLQRLADMRAVIHMQPCHWLSDRRWLKDKLGSLYRYAFPWAQAVEFGCQLQWGSDSPIERPSLLDNLDALRMSRECGIPKLEGDSLRYHSHRDLAWGSNCESQFSGRCVQQVIFDGKILFSTKGHR